MIKAIVFDFDGVLADSEPLHLRAYQEVLSQFGVTLSREDYYANYLGYDDEGVFAQLTEVGGRYEHVGHGMIILQVQISPFSNLFSSFP